MCHKKLSETKAAPRSVTGKSLHLTPLWYPGTWLYSMPSSWPKQKPAFCPSVYNLSQTSRSSHPSPTSWKHSSTSIYFQTSFLCPQFRELLESFFYYISLELPLPSSPRKSAWDITFWPALIAKLLSQMRKDRFSSESNLNLWNVFVPASSSVTLELDANPRVSSGAPLWGCH